MIEIPKFLSHLPVFAGMPIAFTVYVGPDGKPDFRISDLQKQIHCYVNNWCAICGCVMIKGDYWFIGGPKSMESGHFTDGPMHQACAEFSAKICPFLNGQKTEHSTRPYCPVKASQKVIIHSNVDTVRPDKMAMRRAKEYHPVPKGNGGIFYIVTLWHSSPRWF